jgi:hypothetical protein
MPELIIYGITGATTKVDMSDKSPEQLIEIVKEGVKK